MFEGHVSSRRAFGLLGSFGVHAVLVALLLWVAPKVHDFVGGESEAGEAGATDVGPFIRSSQVGRASSEASPLHQVAAAMAGLGPERPATRLRLAVERVLDHLWQSTLFAIVVAVMALVLRRNRARVRHALWLAASVKFFVPLALVVGLGRAVWPDAVAAFETHPLVAGVREPIVQLSRPVLWPASISLDPSRASSGATLAAIWACGFVVVAAVRVRQWRRLEAQIDTATPMELPLGVPDAVDIRQSNGRTEPIVIGWQQPALLLPAGLGRILSPTQIRAVVAHLQCHVRRRDNLTAVSHMVVEALFWFHPLVWWLGRRLAEERQRACDEHVLRTVGEAVAYAQAIRAIGAHFERSRLPCVAGAGGHARQRADAIESRRIGEPMGAGRQLAVAMGIAVALFVPLGVGLISAPGRTVQVPGPSLVELPHR